MHWIHLATIITTLDVYFCSAGIRDTSPRQISPLTWTNHFVWCCCWCHTASLILIFSFTCGLSSPFSHTQLTQPFNSDVPFRRLCSTPNWPFGPQPFFSRANSDVPFVQFLTGHLASSPFSYMHLKQPVKTALWLGRTFWLIMPCIWKPCALHDNDAFTTATAVRPNFS